MEKENNITVYEAFMQMDIQMFAKYGEIFFKDVKDKNEEILQRLNAPIGQVATGAFYRLKSNEYE